MKNRLLTYSVLLTLYLIFREGVHGFIKKSFFYDWVKIVDEGPMMLGLLIIWVLVLIGYYVKKVDKLQRSNFRIVSFFVLVTIIYFTERVIFNDWTLTILIVVDLLFLVFLIGEILSILVNIPISKERKNKSFFKLERPKSDTKNDKFDRSFFANRISEQINDSFFEESFSIAIIGEWSSGKSTFLNFIEKKLDNNDKIIIRFNPWSNINTESFYSGFISTIKSELSKYDKNFSTKFDDYYRSISKIEDGVLSRASNAFDNILNDYTTIQSEQKSIKEGLIKLNKQLIVITDDLDRLDSEEIISVFKLIRNIGNFWNTVYITAFDRAYVINALTNISSHRPHEFIDKIFDYEFVLPSISKDYLIRDINQFSKDKLNGLFHINYSSDVSKIVESFITNERDLNRLKMHLQLSYTDIAKELIASELFILELIRFRYPQILAYFYHGYKKYLDNPIISPIDRNYSLVYENNQPRIKKDILLNERHPNNRFHLSSQQIDEIIFSIKYLFEKRKTDLFEAVQPDNPRFNSIRKVPYLPIYFALVFDPNAIKIDQIKNVLNKSWAEVEDYISNKLFYKGLGTKPLQVFEAVKIEFDWFISTKNLYSNTVRLFLSIESLGSPIPKGVFSQFFDVNNSKIMSYFNNINGLKFFLKELLLDSSFTHHGRSHLAYSYIYDYLNDKDYIFILKPLELKRINYSIFDDYLDSSKKSNNILVDIFYRNFDAIDPNTRKVTLSGKACKRFRQFIKNVDSVGYFDLIIRPAMFPNHFKSFVFEPFAEQIFEGWARFERYLGSQKEYKRQDVLLGYFKKFKENAYSEFSLDEKEIKVAPKDFVNMFPDDGR